MMFPCFASRNTCHPVVSNSTYWDSTDSGLMEPRPPILSMYWIPGRLRIPVTKSDTILTCSDNWPGRRSLGICWDTPCKSDGTTPSKILAISRPQRR